MKDLSYNELKMRNYLSAKNVNTDTAKNIFKFRTMMAFLKSNFRTQFANDLQRYECELAEDSQQHLLQHIDIGDRDSQEVYMKLFSSEVEDNLEVVNLLEKGLKRRQDFVPDDEENSWKENINLICSISCRTTAKYVPACTRLVQQCHIMQNNM